MSMRTLVEFNHDMGHKIESRPEEFVAAVLELIRAGESERVSDRLAAFGVKTLMSRHHSTRCRVEYESGLAVHEL